jgi:hypothetical protein
MPDDMTDAALEARLFPEAGTKQGQRRQAQPDWASTHREFKRKHVTLTHLQDEHSARNPEASAPLASENCTEPGKASSRSGSAANCLEA